MIPFSGIVWRIMDANYAGDPLSSVYSAEGRFHHSGQLAIYTSLTKEGAGIAIQRYVGPHDPKRVIIPLKVKLETVVDLRTPSDFLENPKQASRVWHDVRATGAPAPTWAISDKARLAGADGILYLSRSQPAYSHLTILCPTSNVEIEQSAPAENWP